MVKKLIFGNIEDFGCLHCHNPDCEYELPEPLPLSEDLIGFRCPMCGTDILSEKDYRLIRRTIGLVAFVNSWFGWLGMEQPPTDATAMHVKVEHGNLRIH